MPTTKPRIKLAPKKMVRIITPMVKERKGTIATIDYYELVTFDLTTE
jgi:hypothetical protein